MVLFNRWFFNNAINFNAITAVQLYATTISDTIATHSSAATGATIIWLACVSLKRLIIAERFSFF